MVKHPIESIGRSYFLDQYRKNSDVPESGFKETLGKLLEKYGEIQGQAAEKSAAVLAGGSVDSHDVMIAVEEASLAFELILEVRNRLVEAYQELVRMQF